MRKRPITLLAIVLLTATLVWIRGTGFAEIQDGRYPFKSFAVDLISFSVLLLVLGLLSRAIRLCCQRWLKERGWLQALVYPLAMIMLAFPMLLVAIQLHPPHVIGGTAYTPAKLGLAFQNVALQSDGLKLAGWFIPAEKSGQPIVLMAHGLGGNKTQFLFLAKPLHEAGLNVFTFDFRAHGESEGRTFTFGLNEAHDVKAAYEWLKQHHANQPIYALGFSMGGAAVAHAAADYHIFDRIVLDSAFASFENVAKSNRFKLFGPLSGGLWQLSRGWAWIWTQRDFADNQPARQIAKRTDCRLFVIHGTADEIAPVSEASLYKEATASFSTVWLIEGCKHAQGYRQPDYAQRLSAFFTTQ